MNMHEYIRRHVFPRASALEYTLATFTGLGSGETAGMECEDGYVLGIRLLLLI